MKVQELEGVELDVAVARAEGHKVEEVRPGEWKEQWPAGHWLYIRHPSTTWAHAGPIIERKQISIIRMGGPSGFWLAGFDPECDQGSQCESGWIELPAIEMRHQQSGATPLIAAMRAYVASKEPA